MSCWNLLTCIAISRIVSMILKSLAWAIHPVILNPCCNQFWKHRFIYKTGEYTHYAAPPLQSSQRNSVNSCLADGETRLRVRGEDRVGGSYCTSWRQPTHRQTSYLAVQWVSSTVTALSAWQPHIQLILRADNYGCARDDLYTHTTSKWQQTGKKYNAFTKSLISKLEEEEGKGGWLVGCEITLALCEQVQWKIVPTANPWQTNYSFDPLGVCITIGGRVATHSGAQYSHG